MNDQVTPTPEAVRAFRRKHGLAEHHIWLLTKVGQGQSLDGRAAKFLIRRGLLINNKRLSGAGRGLLEEWRKAGLTVKVAKPEPPRLAVQTYAPPTPSRPEITLTGMGDVMEKLLQQDRELWKWVCETNRLTTILAGVETKGDFYQI